MIELKNIYFNYKDSEQCNSLHHINLTIKKGEVLLLCGKSGCGKTTITRLINGLIPHFYPGQLTGEVLIKGQNILEQSIYETAKTVGSVFQNPRSQFFNVDTTSEVVFGCENMGWDIPSIDNSLKHTIHDFKIQNLMDRSLFQLSGGEKQKIACAAVSMSEPDILVLDEPASNLDWHSIQSLADIIKKWKQQGKTIIIAEHRLSYLKDAADRVIYMENGHIISDVTAGEFWALSPKEIENRGLRSLTPASFKKAMELPASSKVIKIQNFDFAYSKSTDSGIHIPRLELQQGSIIGVLGENGAGKTTFARCLCGLEKKAKGQLILGEKPYNSKQRLKLCYLVMQDVNHQLFTESVQEEIVLSMNSQEMEDKEKQAAGIISSMDLLELKELHPLSLSGGEKQRVAVGSAIASSKEILIFDEPTSGLDYHHMLEVAKNLKRLSKIGKTLFIITHDPELIAQCCNYFIFIEQGEISWRGGWNEENKRRLTSFFESYPDIK